MRKHGSSYGLGDTLLGRPDASYSVTSPWKIVYTDRWPSQPPSASAGQI